MRVYPDLQDNVLTLELSEEWNSLEYESKKELSEHWQKSALDMDYKDIVLEDTNGNTIGRSARVGKGIIFLEE